MRHLLLAYLCILVVGVTYGQRFITKTEVTVGDTSFLSESSQKNPIKVNFKYNKPDQVALVRLFLSNNLPDSLKVEHLKLVPSGDYELVDSLLNYNNEFYAFKVRFKNINNSELLHFQFKIFTKNKKKPHIEVIDLIPYTETEVSIITDDSDFFIGDEKVLPLASNNIGNIRTIPQWINTDAYDYKVTASDGELKLHIIPLKYGKMELSPELKTIHPNKINDEFTDNIKPKPVKITVKESRVSFLGINIRDFTFDEVSRKEGIEIEIDDHRLLQLNKTYRIENQEESGGYLVAELYTKSHLNNGKVLSTLRLYNLHKQSAGYLYIKDGDYVRFITNFSSTPQTRITSLLVMHKGEDWTTTLNVYPGENIKVKIIGEGLNKADFIFKEVSQVENDTLINDDKTKYFTLQVPVNIDTRVIEVYNHSQNTGQKLRVQEYKLPRDFDFININYGEGSKEASSLNKPILYDKVMQDVLVSFSPNMIDSDKKIYGEQHFTIRVKITTNDNLLIDQQEIRNLVVCPGRSSPRFEFYDQDLSTTKEINLNNYLRKKTYDMEGWSRLEIEIEHLPTVYGSPGFKQRIEIIYQRHSEFDIDVSFPAGLLVRKEGDTGIGNFGGISMAMMAQFSFFHPHKIARYRPYKIGAGFLALNAFNYNENQNITRDVGLVVIGSVYPMGSKGKLTFPLYLGGGYLLAQEKWFTLLGPGIRISF